MTASSAALLVRGLGLGHGFGGLRLVGRGRVGGLGRVDRLGDRLGGRPSRPRSRRGRSSAMDHDDRLLGEPPRSAAYMSSAGTVSATVANSPFDISSQGGGSGRLSAIAAKRGGVLFGDQALEEVGHLGLEGVDATLDALDASLDVGRVGVDLALEASLAVGDALVGLFADPGDLGLGPVADRRDVIVGLLAQLGRLDGGRRVDRLDVGLGIGAEARERVGLGGLRRALHGAWSGRP